MGPTGGLKAVQERIFPVSGTIFLPSHVEFLVIAFVTKFAICPRESGGVAELDVTDILDAVYNLWLKISYNFW
jgi:hypothetical protein